MRLATLALFTFVGLFLTQVSPDVWSDLAYLVRSLLRSLHNV